jgi:hypothetical protein
MARGWESKAVEDQMSDREAGAATRQSGRARTEPVDPAREARRRTLQLARARALQDLQLACDRRHRALLEQTIEHLDAELAEFSG